VGVAGAEEEAGGGVAGPAAVRRGIGLKALYQDCCGAGGVLRSALAACRHHALPRFLLLDGLGNVCRESSHGLARLDD